MEIADEKAKKFSEILSQYLSLKELYEHKDSEGWSMTVDLLNLKVDSTHPRTVYGRPFIPTSMIDDKTKHKRDEIQSSAWSSCKEDG